MRFLQGFNLRPTDKLTIVILGVDNHHKNGGKHHPSNFHLFWAVVLRKSTRNMFLKSQRPRVYASLHAEGDYPCIFSCSHLTRLRISPRFHGVNGMSYSYCLNCRRPGEADAHRDGRVSSSLLSKFLPTAPHPYVSRINIWRRLEKMSVRCFKDSVEQTGDPNVHFPLLSQ